MSLDPKSLERLRELGRKLPKSLPVNKTSSSQKKPSNLHIIETESSPDNLFKELINVSQDGTIPPHLIERMKEIEAVALDKQIIEKRKNAPETTDKNIFHKKQKTKRDTQMDELYTEFNQILLEEDSDQSF